MAFLGFVFVRTDQQEAWHTRSKRFCVRLSPSGGGTSFSSGLPHVIIHCGNLNRWFQCLPLIKNRSIHFNTCWILIMSKCATHTRHPRVILPPYWSMHLHIERLVTCRSYTLSLCLLPQMLPYGITFAIASWTSINILLS